MAHTIYRNKNGDKVPSVTTIISKRKEADGMIYRAWELGIEGKDYKEEWGSKANSGTLAHRMTHETDINLAEYTENVIEKATIGYNNFLQWESQTKLEREASEVKLVCECHQCGGTLDGIWILDGKRYLGDIKTGKLYYDHLIQVSAYAHIWTMNHPDKPIEGYILLHFDKDNADFSHNQYTDLSEAWQAFEHMRALYDLVNNLKKRI